MNAWLLNGLGVLGVGALVAANAVLWVWFVGVVREFRREARDRDLGGEVARLVAEGRAKDAVIEKQNADLDALHEEAAQLRVQIQGRIGIYQQH